MSGHTDKHKDKHPLPTGDPQAAQRHWEESMLVQLQELRHIVSSRPPQTLAAASGGKLQDGFLEIAYWGSPVRCELKTGKIFSDDMQQLSTFDQSMILFYLRTSDGTPPADHWVSFRELPGGVFYNQAFQGYTGRLLAERFGNNPEMLNAAAAAVSGTHLPALCPAAWRFLPLPKLPLAVALWPGDDELPSQAKILFDAAAGGKMTTDGLALLGARLASMLLKAASS
ncbi:MAG: DUF3786 domain-containing protein [Anaerolineales bacterium]|nr:DUF3786 domain-containing protein [Anaerolineales bacterium]